MIICILNWYPVKKAKQNKKQKQKQKQNKTKQMTAFMDICVFCVEKREFLDVLDTLAAIFVFKRKIRVAKAYFKGNILSNIKPCSE